MKSKTLINFDLGRESFFDLCARGRPSWGEILAESYWKQDKSGAIIESTPRTSEILTALFFPFEARPDGFDIKIENIQTGLKIETLTEAGGVHVERIIFKPDPRATRPTPEALRVALLENFKRRHAAND
jgi:hypothetical protein